MRAITLEQAKAQYTNRYTMEHIPQWAKEICDNGKYYAPQYTSDLEWYNNTKFAGEGGIADRKHCYSNGQSWPIGQWLDKPL